MIEGIDVLRTLMNNQHFSVAEKLSMFFQAWKPDASEIVVRWVETLPHEEKLEAIAALQLLQRVGKARS